MPTKVRRGKGRVRDHEGDIEALIEFMGYDLLEQVSRISKVTRLRETLQVAGEILDGTFKLSITFNGETKH